VFLVVVISRLMQILLLIYCIPYLLIYRKGYQAITTSIISTITTDVIVINTKPNPNFDLLYIGYWWLWSNSRK
jgi:hypothetical protein